jgi:hypothetical protein
MATSSIEHSANLWLVNGVPARMIYAGRRWRVSDTPTRFREPVWALPLEGPRAMFGWRFQATDESGVSLVFDVFKSGEDDWHVHRSYE